MLLIIAATLFALGGVRLWRRLGSGIALRERIDLDFLAHGGALSGVLSAENVGFWNGTDRGGALTAIRPAEQEPDVERGVEAVDHVVEYECDDDIDDAPAFDLDNIDAAAPYDLDETCESESGLSLEAVALHEEPFRPDLPLPWEPADPPVLTAPWYAPSTIATVVPVVRGARNPVEQLQQRHDRVAAETEAAFAEVHRLRVLALRQARGAERTAQCAAAARAHANRMSEGDRRFAEQGRVRPARLPAAEDAYGSVHRLRTEALRQASRAENLAERVDRARERAASLLAQQRTLAAELRASRIEPWMQPRF